MTPVESGQLELYTGQTAHSAGRALSAHMPAPAGAAWAGFRAAHGSGWHATWDAQTGVPSHIVGVGIDAPDAVESAPAAALAARDFLASHIDLVAPGAAPEDFVIVSNHLDRSLETPMRTVGMHQYHHGMRVIGGQVSFRFKNDRLFVIASQSFPQVSIDHAAIGDGPTTSAVGALSAQTTVSAEDARALALDWIRVDRGSNHSGGHAGHNHGHAAAGAPALQTSKALAGPGADNPGDADLALSAEAPEGPYILPVITAGGDIEYHPVVALVASAYDPDDTVAPHRSWTVYVAADGSAPVARASRLRYADAALMIEAPVRYPESKLALYPAPYMRARPALNSGVNGPLIANAEGVITWPGDGPLDVTLETVGPWVEVVDTTSAVVSNTQTLNPDVSVIWSAEGEPVLDAYLSTFVHAGIAKEFALRFVQGLPFLEQPLRAKVNIGSTCNAFSDGKSINFYRKSQYCENTGRLADVIYHEYGHVVHFQSVITGAGTYDAAFSEGLSDYLAATITGDPGVGRGFYFDDTPIRHLDPPDREQVWPDDIAEIHTTGLIFGGAMWDLRKRLIERYGEAAGVEVADRLFFAVVRRAANIPATYLEILTADDNDGNLTNGTPHGCDISAAFGAHGLRTLEVSLSPLASEQANSDGHPLVTEFFSPTNACPGDRVTAVRVNWMRDGSASGTFALAEDGLNRFAGRFPSQPSGVNVRYRLEATLDDGTVRTYPENPADPWLGFYVGELVPLYCTDFESDPSLDGWRSGPSGSWTVGNANDWQWGAPTLSAGGDPGQAYSGKRVFGNDLGSRNGDGDGSYSPNKVNYAFSPVVDVGNFSDVRLQYRRWLNVEDGFYDRALIYANRELVWQNLASEDGQEATTHHRDRQWVFHDVPLSPAIDDGSVELKFEMQSDRGFQLGGWTIDDLCIVAVADSICGDGQVSPAEECDNGAGNSDQRPNACRETCRAASCGDGIIDAGETCDDGNQRGGDGCERDCTRTQTAGDGDGGCTLNPPAGQGHPLGALVLVGLTLCGLVATRRRRHLRKR